MKLGEYLVHAGRITAAELEETLKEQAIFGGKLGTNLVEMGYLDEHDLAHFLSKKTGFPHAAPEQLMDIPPQVVKILSEDVVRKHRVVPIALNNRKLSLAMTDPSNYAIIDQISFMTGYIVVPLITPEFRLIGAMEKYYNIRRDQRYISVAGGGRNRTRTPPSAFPAAQQTVPAQPAPVQQASPIRPTPNAPDDFDIFDLPLLDEFECFGDMDVQETNVQAHTQGPVPAPAQTLAPAPAQAAPTQAAPTQAAPTQAPPAQAAPAPAPAPVQAPAAVQAAIRAAVQAPLQAQTQAPRAPAASVPQDEAEKEYSLDEILQGLAEAQDRNSIADLIVGYAAQQFHRSALFLLKGDKATGWVAQIGKKPLPGFEMLEIPLSEPSVLKTVADSKAYYLGPLPISHFNSRIAAALGGSTTTSHLLVPLMMVGRVVAILHVEGGTPNPDQQILDLQKLLGKGSMAFEILILKSKILYS